MELCKRTTSLLVLFLAVAAIAHAQSDTITANPNAATLHRIWTVYGNPAGLSAVADGFGSVGDVNEDGIDDFAVHFGGEQRWKVYYGASPKPSDTPAWQYRIYALQPEYPVIGDFWGTGHKAVVFGERVQIHGCCDRCLLNIFRTDSGHIEAMPSIKQDTLKLPMGDTWLFVEQLAVADLDGDGADELIVTGISPNGGAIWIYRGGAGFQVDTPAVVINDADEAKNNDPGLKVIAGDFDGDGHLDMISGGNYLSGEKMKFYWGGAGSPWNWQTPDRVITHNSTMPGFDGYYGLIAYDSDGDRIPDIQVGYSCMFRSRTGKDIRTRPFTYADVDNRFIGNGFNFNLDLSVGFLNDIQRKYAMTSGFAPNATNTSGKLLAFSGGTSGPDAAYEASYDPSTDGFGSYDALEYGRALGDVTGDGYTDYFGASAVSQLDEGIGLILAGGPYIPRDSLMSGIGNVAAEGKKTAISLWPNPAHDEVHIAWRGDLKFMPNRFEAYNSLGQRVATGVVQETGGEAVWRCRGVAAGCYYITMFARDGSFITTVPVIIH